MDPLTLGSILGIGRDILDRVFPDPARRAEVELELLRAQQEGAFKEMDAQLQANLAQVEVNKVEGASENLFKAGWRPAVGWVCVAAFAYAGLGRPLIPFVAGLFGHQVPELPPIDDVFTELLFGMLGLGGMRTFEKFKSR